MNEEQNDEHAWARPGSEAAASAPSTAVGLALPPAPPVAAPQPEAPRKRGDWQTIAAIILFPIPVALWIGFFALVFGVIDLPDVIPENCTTECLALQEDVRATYTDPRACDGSGPRLCFVPMGSISKTEIEKLTAYYRERYGIQAAVLPGIDLQTSDLDTELGVEQAYAPDLWQRVRDYYPALGRDPGVTLIGLTTVDMYLDSETAGWFDFTMAFYRGGEKLAIVSTAEMHPKILWFKLEERGGDLRLQKRVNQLVGLMHFGLQQSTFPNDAMYWDATSPWALDRMAADLPIAKR